MWVKWPQAFSTASRSLTMQTLWLRASFTDPARHMDHKILPWNHSSRTHLQFYNVLPSLTSILHSSKYLCNDFQRFYRFLIAASVHENLISLIYVLYSISCALTCQRYSSTMYVCHATHHRSIVHVGTLQQQGIHKCLLLSGPELQILCQYPASHQHRGLFPFSSHFIWVEVLTAYSWTNWGQNVWVLNVFLPPLRHQHSAGAGTAKSAVWRRLENLAQRFPKREDAKLATVLEWHGASLHGWTKIRWPWATRCGQWSTAQAFLWAVILQK